MLERGPGEKDENADDRDEGRNSAGFIDKVEARFAETDPGPQGGVRRSERACPDTGRSTTGCGSASAQIIK